MLDGLRKDLRFALRQLWHKPGFTAVAIVVLSLGLGANAAIFSVVNAALLRPLPFAHPDKLVALFEKDVLPDDPYNDVAPGNYLDWRRDARNFEQMAATTGKSFNLSSSSESFAPQRVPGALCSANLFETLGVRPVIGRTFRGDEDRPGAPDVAVISYALWKQRFAGSPEVIHQEIKLDENNYKIIGVMPQGFVYLNRKDDVWVTLQRHLTIHQLESHGNHGLFVIGRLRPDRTIEQGQQEIDAIVRRYKEAHPAEIMGKGASAVRLDWYLVHDVRASLLILLASVGCLLLIACVNIANLMLTRAVGRQRELAIRASLGATRAQIVRQLLIESTAVSLLGAIAGLVVTSWTSSFLALHILKENRLPQAVNIHLDMRVLFFTIGLALLTGVAAGLFPALTASRTDVVNSLKEGTRSAIGGRSQSRLRDVLVGLEVALSLMLLIAAGLLLRSFVQLQNVRPGFRMERTITMAVSLPHATYKERARIVAFARQLVAGVRNLPGVRSAGLIDCVPLDGHCSDTVFQMKGHPLPPGQMMDLLRREADPNYFRAAGVPLLKGRTFTERDGQGYDDAHPQLDSAIISESAARKYFPNMDPIGQTLAVGSDAGPIAQDPKHPYPDFEVIGVVGDVLASIDEPVQETVYMPLLDGYSNEIYIFAHTMSDPRSVISAIRSEISRLDRDLPVHDVRTSDEIAIESTARRQFSLVLISLFAGLAVLLAAIGLYGVVSYAVSQRTAEIGIRMALGAARREVSRMVLIEGMKPALVGIVIGLFVAALASRALRSMLFGVGANDPLTFAAVPLVLIFVVVFACTIPALRATKINPTIALRAE
jgi:predicted permease